MTTFPVIEGIQSGQETFGGDLVPKMIDDLYWRHRLGGLNHDQMRKILQGFRYEIMNDIGEEEG